MRISLESARQPAMPIKHIHRLIICAGLISQLLVASAVVAKAINLPTVSPEQAIAIAQEYIKNHKIEISRHFLAKIEYVGLYDEYQKPFWRIEWRPLGRIKGGQIFILVYPDGSAALGLGE